MLKNIDGRESLIETLQSLASRFGTGQFVKKHLVSREVKNLVVSLRFSTLETVESISRWREGARDNTKPFIWRNQNYLVKMQDDTQFLMDSELRLMTDISNATRNPMLMPVSGGSFDSFASPPRKKLKESKATGEVKKKLPPLRASVAGGERKIENVRERVLNAEKIIFAERSNERPRSPDSPIRGAEKSPTVSVKPHILARQFFDNPKTLPEIPPLPIGENKPKLRPKSAKKKRPKKERVEIPFTIDESMLPDLPPLPVDPDLAANTISAALSGKLTRNKFRLLRLEKLRLDAEEKERQHKLDIQRRELAAKNSAATKIQSGFRGQRARRQVATLKEKIAAAPTIQALVRGVLLRKVLKQRKAAVKIQSRYRGISARDRVKQIRIEKQRIEKENKAATTLQKNQRAIVERKKYSRVLGSVATLQRGMWMFLARLRVKSLHQEYVSSLKAQMEEDQRTYNAATMIQTRARIALARMSFNNSRIAVCTIQDGVRVHLAKLKVDHARRQALEAKALHQQRSHAATMIQSLQRSIAAQKKVEELKQQLKAVVLLQNAVRSLFARQTVHTQLTEYYAARKIQANVRGRQGRKLVLAVKKQNFEIMEDATITIQQATRYLFAKQRCYVQTKALELKLRKELEIERAFYENANAITIQRALRCLLAQQQAKKQVLSLRSNFTRAINTQVAQELETYKNKSAKIIQNASRTLTARRRVDKLRDTREKELRSKQKAKEEAERIQKMITINQVSAVAKYTIDVTKPTKDQCAVLIQRGLRVYLAKNRVKSLRQAYNRSLDELLAKEQYDHKVVTLQLGMRRAIAFKRTLAARITSERIINQQIRRDDSIILIQMNTRSFLARLVFQQILLENISATKIQSTVRGRIARRYVEKLRKEQQEKLERDAAQRLQCNVRVMNARARVKKLKQALDDTINAEVEQERIMLNNAALKIQSGARMIIAKNEKQILLDEIQRKHEELKRLAEEKQKRQNESASAIQRSVRTRIAVGRVKELKQARKRLHSTRLVQNNVQVMIARRRVQKLKTEFDAQINEHVQRELVSYTNAAITLQAGARMVGAKNDRNALLEEKQEVQKQLQERLAEKQKLELNGTILLQRGTRIMIARRKVKTLANVREQLLVVEERQLNAAVRLQSATLMLLAKSRTAAMRKQVEAKFKAEIEQDDKLTMDRLKLASIAVIQSGTRTWLAKHKVTLQKRTFDQQINDEIERERLDIEEAVTTLQAARRAQNARRIAEQKRLEKEAFELEQERAALVIQKHMKDMLDKKRESQLREDTKREYETATRLQCSVLCALARIRVTKARVVFEEELEKEIALEKQEFEAAALKVMKLKTKEAAMVVQRGYRSFVARKRVSDLSTRRKAEEKLQHQREASASTIQLALHVFNARRRTKQVRVEVTKRMEKELQEERMKYGITTIQHAIRTSIATKRVKLLSKEREKRLLASVKEKNAVTIQRGVHVLLARRRVNILAKEHEKRLLLEDRQLEAAVRLQSGVLVMIARRKVNSLIKDHEKRVLLEERQLKAAARLQNGVLVMIARRKVNSLAKEHEKRVLIEERHLNAAARIQTATLVMLARMTTSKRRIAVNDQLKAELEREKQEYAKAARAEAIALLQRAIRTRLATTTLQNARKLRDVREREEVERERIRMNDSIVMIQKAVRVSSAKQRHAILVSDREKKIANELTREKQEYEASITKIQQSIRMQRAKNVIKDLRSQKDAEIDKEVERERLSMKTIVV